jgi:ribosomal protein L37AE/L43A
MTYISPRKEQMTVSHICRDCGQRMERNRGRHGIYPALCWWCGQAQTDRGYEVPEQQRDAWAAFRRGAGHNPF